LNSLKEASEKAASLLSEVLNLVNSISLNAVNSSQQLADATEVIDQGLQEEAIILICAKFNDLIAGTTSTNAVFKHGSTLY
jgi:hypothetical protein